MANKNPAVIKMNKDGQVFHQSGASMGSFSAASSQSHKNLLADANPSGGLGYNKTVTVLKGGKRKQHRTQKRKRRRSGRSAKRFRKGGQPWGCFSGGRKSKRRRNRRKSSRKKTRKH